MAVCNKCGYPIDTTPVKVQGRTYHEHCASGFSKFEKEGSIIDGTVKWFSNDKGYGFILIKGKANDLFFHISEYKSEEPIQNGDKVAFEIGSGRNNKPAAINVRFIERARNPRQSKPYYGKPTSKKGEYVPKNTGTTLGGIGIGLLFGPIGGLIGGLLGSGGFERAPGEKITSPCLKCGGTGNVTNIDENFIGFQCEKCKSFWKKRNKDRITMSDVER